MWAGISLAVTALVVAIVNLPIWGSPKIDISFRDNRRNDHRTLECEIYNEPISRGILNLLHIRRAPAIDVIGGFGIFKSPSQERVFYEHPKINLFTGSAAIRVSIPASYLGAFFIIVAVDENGMTFAMPNEGKRQPIPTGLYNAEVRITADGQEIRKAKNFVIQSDPPYAYWVSS